jgi:thiamine-monophosphate kinase
MSSEWTRIALLRAALAGPADPRVLLGIGDDAAVLAPSAEPLVWTVDAAVEGVHFRRDLLSFADLGYRATMAAASDLGAMGARPLGLLAALVLPPALDDAELAELARGQREAADALGAAILGGNLARGAELSITTTALGTAARPLGRAGARPGDAIWMAGPVGLAAAGLAVLLRGVTDEGALSAAARAAITAWRRPRARIAEGLRAVAIANAAIDVSDGLAQDVGHLARASGVRAILDAAALVGPELQAAAAELGRDPLDLALSGGEDYALVVVLAPGDALEGFTRIGEIAPRGEGPVTGEPAVGGADVSLRHPNGSVTSLVERGFDHFGS